MIWSLTAVLIAGLAPAMRAQITLEPSSIDLSLEPGQEFIETKTVRLPGGSPGTPVDIYFLADTTGSMDPVLDQVQDDAEAILQYLSSVLDDGRFGLGEYKDFPNDAFAFRNNASLTANIATVLAGINALSRGGGGDGCEGQFFALDQISDPADPFGIGFRPEAQKIIVWFGDAPAHDPVCSAISGLPYDITQSSVTAKLVDGGFTVVAIGTTTGFGLALNDNPHHVERQYRDYIGVCTIGGSSGQATAITVATGGVSMQDVEPQNISAAIIDAIEFVVSKVTVGLSPRGDILLFTQVLTPPYVDTPLPLSPSEFLTLEFQIKFTGQPCDPNIPSFVFTGNVDAIVDGAEAATQDVTIREPTCDNQPPVCDAGGPYSIECQPGTTSIQLDGSESHDPPLDDVITYAWSSDRPDASFDDSSSPTPILTLNSDGGCASPATVFLTVTDRFGFSTECEAVVQVTDTTDPVFDTFPPDRTVECGAATDPAALGEPTGHDNCGGTTITYSDASAGGCGGTAVITRTWRISDTCGNLIERDQVITVEDTTDPQFDTFPPDATVECGDPTDPAHTGEPTASDVCGDVAITHTDASESGCGNTQTITRTWRIADDCGNFVTRDQVITVLDRTDPQFDTFPPDLTLECTAPTDPAHTGTPTGSDACGAVTITHSDTNVPGCGNTQTITRTWRVEDACGRFSERNQVIRVVDTTAPQFDTFPPDATLECPASTSPSELGEPAGSDTCGDVTITYTDSFAPECGDAGTITRHWHVEDACGNVTEQDQVIRLVDSTAPVINCPPDISIICNAPSDPENTGWATATDDCDSDPQLSYEDDIEIQPCWWEGVVTRTWTATDACGNSTSCTQMVTVFDPRIPRAYAGAELAGAGSAGATIRWDLPQVPPEKADRGGPTGPGAPRPVSGIDVNRVSGSAKGSLLVYPKIELRWNAAGELIEDTIVTINNDAGAEVSLQMYFVSESCTHVDNVIRLSENEPAYWSSATGQPKGVSPFTVLGHPYPDPEGSDDLVLRGYLMVWAINGSDYAQIRWNHLTGGATIVSYYGGAWEYDAYAFAALNVAEGEQVGDVPGLLNLDGHDYDQTFDTLLLGFFASGSMALSGPGKLLTHDTELTLLIVENDFRSESDGPRTTKAKFDIFNQNEAEFSEMQYCFTKWNSSLLSNRGGHFLLENLQTDKGQARIIGVQSALCPDSSDQALLGVAVDIMTFDSGR